jgi:hypothetical protein
MGRETRNLEQKRIDEKHTLGSLRCTAHRSAKMSAIIVLTLFLTAALQSYGELDPGAPWPSFGGNQQHTGHSAVGWNSSNVGAGFLWSFMTTGSVYSTPAIASDGSIYATSDDGFLYALDRDGALLWSLEVGSRTQLHTPAITTDSVFVSTAGSYLYAVNRSSGALQWLAGTHSDAAVSPVVSASGDVIFIGSSTGIVQAITTLSGSIVWSKQVRCCITSGLEQKR